MVLKVLTGKILETLKLWCTGTRLRLHFGNPRLGELGEENRFASMPETSQKVRPR